MASVNILGQHSLTSKKEGAIVASKFAQHSLHTSYSSRGSPTNVNRYADVNSQQKVYALQQNNRGGRHHHPAKQLTRGSSAGLDHQLGPMRLSL